MAEAAGSPAPSPLEIARSVAGAARAHDDVVDLDAGLAREFATYGLGGRVPGVRVERDQHGTQVRLRIVVRYGRPIPDVGDEVRERVEAALVGVDRPAVHVHVADVAQVVDELPTAPTELQPPGAS
jgi:uncharacterized alkaline shock family protein YloU